MKNHLNEKLVRKDLRLCSLRRYLSGEREELPRVALPPSSPELQRRLVESVSFIFRRLINLPFKEVLNCCRTFCLPATGSLWEKVVAARSLEAKKLFKLRALIDFSAGLFPYFFSFKVKQQDWGCQEREGVSETSPARSERRLLCNFVFSAPVGTRCPSHTVI